jgi:hypothetical protein
LLFVAALLIHWLMLYSLPTGLLDPLFHDATRQPGKGLDFYSIYQAGYNVRHGMSAYYGVREHKFGAQYQVVPYFSGFRYLPVYAYTYGILLNVLPPRASYWAWIVVVEGMLIVCLALTFVLAGDLRRFLPLAAVWLAYSPYYLELYIGQQSFVTALMLLLMGYAVLRRRARLFDGAYVFTAVWKLNTLLMAPLMVRLHRFKALLAILIIVVVTSAPYFAIDPGGWREFTSYFGHKFIADGPNSHGLWALVSTVWKRLGADTTALRSTLQLLSLAVIAVSGLVTFLNRRSAVIDLMAVWMTTYFLAYQYVWEHHYVMLLPILVLLLLTHDEILPRVCTVLLCLPTPFALIDLPGVNFPQEHWTFFEDVLLHLWKVGPVLVLWGWLVLRELRRALRERDLWILHSRASGR